MSTQRNDPQALVLRALTQEGREDYEGAARDYKAVIPAFKGNYARMRYAHRDHRLGDHLEAIRVLVEGLKYT